MIFCKKNIIWDLDNTLYRITPEFADILDEATAIAAIEDLGVPLDFETAKAKVKESYRIYRDGVLDGEYTDIDSFWQDDFVSFLIGCSFSFESSMLEANVPVRHIEEIGRASCRERV